MSKASNFVRNQCVSRVTLIPNGHAHLVNKSWGYPTDCSGFVSWALEAGRDVKAYEWSATMYSQPVATEDLRYGDIVTHVWDDTPLRRCSGKSINTMAALGAESHPVAAPRSLYMSGHVFFFDRWDDDNRTHFWAYESTETADQTQACKAETGVFTRPLCFNHHVRKSRGKTIDKWRNDSCHDATYGTLTGGPRRLVPTLLCPRASADREPRSSSM